jgi:hypothetical protein
MKIYFLAFATSDLFKSLKRIRFQASNMGIYNEIYTWTESNLERRYFLKNKDKLIIGSRGFGYWSWKPQIIKQALENLHEGDVLQYTDAGCHLNLRGKSRLIEYIQLTKTSESGILAFQGRVPDHPLSFDIQRTPLDLEDRKWVKGDLLDYFAIRDNQEVLSSPTIGAGIIFIRKCNKSVEIINKWSEVIDRDFSLIDDTPSKSNNPKGFIENRHDQAIFSILCKINSVDTLSAYEYWYPLKNKKKPDWSMLKNYPIHAKRDLDYGVIKNLQKLIIRLKKKILKAFYEKIK